MNNSALFQRVVADWHWRLVFVVMGLLVASAVNARDIKLVWPAGKMPHSQSHQVAVMDDEKALPGYNPEKHRVAYIEWMPKPYKQVRTDACMILISGGSYQSCCDINLLNEWSERLTREGIQCVKLVYRTPRPEGLPIYQTAWEDAQRAVRMVRSEAEKRGFNPEKIGTISIKVLPQE